MSENGNTERVIPSELSILRQQYADQNDRDAVDRAYWAHATGDPETFPVHFSVLVAANAELLKAYPGRLKKTLDLQTKKLVEAIAAEHAPVKASAAEFSEDIKPSRVDIQGRRCFEKDDHRKGRRSEK